MPKITIVSIAFIMALIWVFVLAGNKQKIVVDETPQTQHQ